MGDMAYAQIYLLSLWRLMYTCSFGGGFELMYEGNKNALLHLMENAMQDDSIIRILPSDFYLYNAPQDPWSDWPPSVGSVRPTAVVLPDEVCHPAAQLRR